MSWWRDWRDAGRTFSGGLYLPDEKGATARSPIVPFSPAPELLVPLRRAAQLPTEPRVSAGQRVSAGDLLAEASSEQSLSVRAPTAGTVVELDRVWTARDGYLPAARLTPDAPARWFDAPLPTGPRPARTLADLVDAGVFEPRGHQSLPALLTRARLRGVDTLLISAVETEPLVTADLRTLVEDHIRIIDAARRVADLIDARLRPKLVVSLRHRHLVRQLRGAAPRVNVDVVALNDKYPQGHPHLLCRVMTRRRVPAGGSPIDVGVCVLSLAAVRAAADALCDGRPSVSRVVTVTGPLAERPANWLVPFGLPVAALLEAAGCGKQPVQPIAGGPLTGVAVHEATALTPDVAALCLLPPWEGGGAAEPCIHCGWCVEDCPVGLDPVGLMTRETRGEFSPRLAALVETCIGCGLCSFVCPTELPLAESIRRMSRRVAWQRESRP